MLPQTNLLYSLTIIVTERKPYTVTRYMKPKTEEDFLVAATTYQNVILGNQIQATHWSH